ncbi:Fur family transcriptional regulator [Marinobacter sp. 1_MG-2023]|uniref:Fur family transcriptional regulator n=1 Tax=Marinobacter sp. 1_MG-2023 TaxID=3062627 RepID=UPI0026E3EE17|nr:transcriptional repressor [Marinobacter sp. 1_MG-2023]MDO6824885.1 transcriptional repressor [Marinobacter sp. 1_MG-2023]
MFNQSLRALNHMTSLTPNQRRVFDVLLQADASLGAYAILKKTGFRGATQVYRALERLVDLGMARKLESLNAYIAVSAEGHSTPTAFAICDQCGHIHEVVEAQEIKQLHECLAKLNFQVDRTVIEFHGACSLCSGHAYEAKERPTYTKLKQD